MKNMLIIDDDADILNALSELLTSEHYNVTISTNGRALEKIGNGHQAPDVIILDVMLAGLDGRDLCRKIKKDEATKHIPVIMISAHPHVEKSVFKAGADDFIEKPFDINNLVQRIHTLVN